MNNFHARLKLLNRYFLVIFLVIFIILLFPNLKQNKLPKKNNISTYTTEINDFKYSGTENIKTYKLEAKKAIKGDNNEYFLYDIISEIKFNNKNSIKFSSREGFFSEDSKKLILKKDVIIDYKSINLKLDSLNINFNEDVIEGEGNILLIYGNNYLRAKKLIHDNSLQESRITQVKGNYLNCEIIANEINILWEGKDLKEAELKGNITIKATSKNEIITERLIFVAEEETIFIPEGFTFKLDNHNINSKNATIKLKELR